MACVTSRIRQEQHEAEHSMRHILDLQKKGHRNTSHLRRSGKLP